MVRVSSPAKLRPWSELIAKMVMGVVPGLVKQVINVSSAFVACFRVIEKDTLEKRKTNWPKQPGLLSHHFHWTWRPSIARFFMGLV